MTSPNHGVYITKIQKFLGDKSITTSERYLGVKFEETAQAISVFDIPSLKALVALQAATPSAKQIATLKKIAISRIS